jgi:hypothetical protein
LVRSFQNYENGRRREGIDPSAGPNKPNGLALLEDFATMLADVPEDRLDGEINNLGHFIHLVLKRSSPDMSESMQYSLPFAFTELLREKMRRPQN